MVKKNKNGSLHLVITDNETGEVLYDELTAAIVGGVSTNDGSCEVVCVKGNVIDIASATIAAKNSVDECIKRHPEIALLASILEADLIKAEEVKE